MLNIPVWCFLKHLLTAKIRRNIWVGGVGLEENRRISDAFVPRANVANAICQRQDSDERHPGRTAPIESPDWCPQRGTWAGADARLPLLLCNQVATESKCRMAWCDMRSHTESSAWRLQAYKLLCEEAIAWLSEETEVDLTFYFVTLVYQCEEVWWVTIKHRLSLKAVGMVKLLQIQKPLQLKEKKQNNNHGNEDPNYTGHTCQCRDTLLSASSGFSHVYACVHR